MLLWQQVRAEAPVLEILIQRQLKVTAGANIMVHVVPLEVLQFLCRKVDAGHFVRVVIGCMEAVPVAHIDRGIGMPKYQEEREE